MRLEDLPLLVLEDGRHRAVEPSGAGGQRSRVPAALEPLPAASTPISSTPRRQQRGEGADRVRAAPTQAITRSGQPALHQHLLAGLVADHALQVAHQSGIGRGPDGGADHVVGGGDVGHPVPDGLADGLLEGPRAGLDGRAPRLPAAPCAPRSASGGAYPRCPCTPRSRPEQGAGGRGSPRRAGRRRSRRSRALAHAPGERAWPSALLILCAPVCRRSSRLSRTVAPTSR